MLVVILVISIVNFICLSEDISMLFKRLEDIRQRVELYNKRNINDNRSIENNIETVQKQIRSLQRK